MKDILIFISICGYSYCLLILMKYYYLVHVEKRDKTLVLKAIDDKGIFFNIKDVQWT